MAPHGPGRREIPGDTIDVALRKTDRIGRAHLQHLCERLRPTSRASGHDPVLGDHVVHQFGIPRETVRHLLRVRVSGSRLRGIPRRPLIGCRVGLECNRIQFIGRFFGC